MIISNFVFFCLFLVIWLFINDANKSSARVWISFFVFSFLLVTINFFLVELSAWPAFHHGDETYFYESAIELKNRIDSGQGLVDSLLAITWNYKYYGFIYFDYLSIDGVIETSNGHKFSILLALSSIYALTLRHIIKKKVIGNVYVYTIVIPCFVYLSLFNYRDGLIAVILYFLVSSFREKKYLLLIVFSILLFLFRGEFILMIVLGFSSAFVTSFFKHKRLINTGILIFYSVFIMFFFPWKPIDPASVILLLPSLNGVSLVHEVNLFLLEEHYYSGLTLVYFTTILLSISTFILKVISLSFLLLRLSCKTRRDEIVSYGIMHFYFLSLIMYTFLLDGMQDRIKTAFCIILSISVSLLDRNLWKLKGFRFVIFLALALSLLIALRNSRWIL